MITKTKIYKYGIFIESVVISYLELAKQYKVIEKYNNDNRYDIVIQDTENNISKIEIKADKQAYKTNNFYIEYISHDKTSGINTTQADILIYVVEHEDKYILYWINIIHLKHYINTIINTIKKGICKSIDCNGNFNGKFNKGYLIKISDTIYYKVEEILKSNTCYNA
jgi:hypothetical protein